MWMLATCRPGLEVHEADGIAFLSSRVDDIQSRVAAYIDFLFLDVFDGDDLIPDGFTQEGEALPCHAQDTSIRYAASVPQAYVCSSPVA